VGRDIGKRRPLKIVFSSVPDRMTFTDSVKSDTFREHYGQVSVKPDQTIFARVAYGRMSASVLQLARERQNSRSQIVLKSNHAIIDGERFDAHCFMYESFQTASGNLIEVGSLCYRNADFEKSRFLNCHYKGIPVTGFQRKWVPNAATPPVYDGTTVNNGGVVPFSGNRGPRTSNRDSNKSDGSLISRQNPDARTNEATDWRTAAKAAMDAVRSQSGAPSTQSVLEAMVSMDAEG
jgi:hypothetical protein